jgi:hypothetical protein
MRYNVELMAEKKAKGKLSSRILTFDLLRGYFLVAIIIDHLNFFPNGLDWWSARGNLFVTTAEGFFFISGIVLGIVRGQKLIDKPFKFVTKLLLKRAAQLYLTAVILVILFTLLGWWFFMNYPGLKVGILPPSTSLPELIGRSLTFNYIYGWADYLRLYAIFLLASPIAMWLLRKGLWHVLFIASFAIWLLFPFDPKLPDAAQEMLQPLSWQLIFFGGLTIGFYWNKITVWWQRIKPAIQKVAIVSVLGLATVTLLLNIFLVFIVPDINTSAYLPADLHYQLYINFFDKERLPLLRIGLFLLWFWAAFWVFRRFEPIIVRFLGWLLLPFGTNSLYVYTIHAFMIFLAHLWFTDTTLLANFLITVSIIGIIWLMIRYKVLMRVIPR